MINSQTTNWSIFQILSHVLGGRDTQALRQCASAGLFPLLAEHAQLHDVLPALAVRCDEQLAGNDALGNSWGGRVKQALRDNTLRNMQINAQALKLTRQLNKVGITPLFLKGTIQLLNTENKKIGFRKQVDIDLLVEPGKIEAACDVFLTDGYVFCQFPGDQSAIPTLLPDTGTAIRASGAHHHLPPLVKPGYASTVELHRHFLPRRFQRSNPLEPLLASASQHESHGAIFQVPSAEYQLIHLILGKLVHDGHLARRTFPLREACDYIDLLETVEGRIDRELVAQHCGKYYPISLALVTELMAYKARQYATGQSDVSRRIQLMEKRHNSPAMSMLLNTYARALHLAHSLVHSPGKLPAYLNRL